MNDATGPAADPAEILRLSETATPGPWKQKGGYVYRNPADPHNANGFRVDGASSTADAEFIAALRNAAPGLCRRLLELETKLADHKRWWDEVRRGYEHEFPDRPWGACPPEQRTLMLLSRLTRDCDALRAALDEAGQIIGPVLPCRCGGCTCGAAAGLEAEAALARIAEALADAPAGGEGA